ncbi:hypothetical protein O181_046391 [Austropuccinia psidii MF-1]|uniref:Uncharacterized protein n=1 Tax=Austropuccinia psidii MF-1 TaxID=1389203 RepID=A0A9Q3DU37_9BASI|nr:hypothetical protein [Austropuccinia psidii MF-1]
MASTARSLWAHLSQFWPQSQQSQKWPKGPQDPNWPLSTPGIWQPPEATSKVSPQFRGITLLHQFTLYQRIQAWCIYGMIYHYAPILLRNPMIMLSGPNDVVSIKVPKSISHFKGSIFSHSVLQSLVVARRPFEDPNHPALQELGCILFSGLFQG